MDISFPQESTIVADRSRCRCTTYQNKCLDSFRVANNPGTTPLMDTRAFIGSNLPTRRHYFRFARYSGQISILAAVCDVGMVERIFARICALGGIISGASDVRHDLEWAVERQLEELFRSLPVNIAVAGLAGHLSGNVEPLELTVPK